MVRTVNLLSASVTDWPLLLDYRPMILHQIEALVKVSLLVDGEVRVGWVVLVFWFLATWALERGSLRLPKPDRTTSTPTDNFRGGYSG